MLIKEISKKLWSSIFLFVVITILIIASVYFLFTTIDKNRDFQAVLQGYTGGNTNIVELKREITEAETIKSTLEEWLLAPTDTVDLVEYVESISQKVGLQPTIDDLNTQNTINVQGTEAQTLELLVSLEGTFGDVMKFLKIMENVPYQSYLGQVQFNARGSNENLWLIKVQLIVYTNPNHTKN